MAFTLNGSGTTEEAIQSDLARLTFNPKTIVCGPDLERVMGRVLDASATVEKRGAIVLQPSCVAMVIDPSVRAGTWYAKCESESACFLN